MEKASFRSLMSFFSNSTLAKWARVMISPPAFWANFFQRNRQTDGSKLFCHAFVSVVTALADFLQFFQQHRVMTVRAKTNDVDFRAVKAFIKGSKLNAADGFHAVFFPCFQKQFQPVYGIVVGEGNGSDPAFWQESPDLLEKRCRQSSKNGYVNQWFYT